MDQPTLATTHPPSGFSLVEQLACLAVVAVLTTLAVPAMSGLLTRSATRSTADTLFRAAHVARTYAITHDSDTLLCPSLDGHRCDASHGWQANWIVARDRNHDGQPDIAPILRLQPSAHTRVAGTRGRDHVRFRPDGSAAGTNLTLIVCAAASAPAHAVVISNTGRVREAPASADEKSRCTSSK
ncbi:MAG TPA: GspH/FimT family pseudopilin [Rhodanobacteraceae bacterium]